MMPVPEMREVLVGAVHDFVAKFEPWAHEHTYMNFAEGRRQAKTLWTESAHHRLRRVKAAYDPRNMIRSNHPLD